MENPFKYLIKMDIFVLPSLWEGFSNVVLEAMVCEIPVVASNSTDGIREIINHDINGLLVRPKAHRAISESVYYLLSNKEKRDSIVQEAYKNVKQFDVNEIKEQYEALIFN